jgi:hypothetical protein
MKLLERICLIQFFLYEQEDLDVGRNTAFLGPNGTGKTCLLDAVQAVILGADSTRLHFNAQADGKRRDRSLRSYCLGVYDQSGHGCRTESNTFIALVFRDEVTGEVVTAGVALSSREDSAEHVFHGLFILPGVDLRTSDLIDHRNGRPQVMPWKDAQYRLKALVSQAEGDNVPVITPNREEFLRKLLLEHLAAPGDHPNVSMFRNAFQRSLQLKVMDDLSTALRDNLIEGRPTTIKRFRDGVEQFRKMRDLVVRIGEQIASVAEVSAAFGKVRRLRSREVNHKALGATLEVELQASVNAEADEEVDRLSRTLGRARSELVQTTATREDAQRAEREARDERSVDPAHQARGKSTVLLSDRERAVDASIDTLRKELAGARRAVEDAAAYAPLADVADTCAVAIASLIAVFDSIGTNALPDIDALSVAATRTEAVAETARQLVSTAERVVEDTEREKKAADLSLERAAQGRRRLDDNVEALQEALAVAGITASPVCDLVEITDTRWQPVIEAYLGRNVQSLLVRRDDEGGAIQVQRRLLRSDAIAGAKVILPSRLQGGKTSPGGRYAANLVRGQDPDAVAYVRGELGITECVETNAELRELRRAFTVDGMIAAGSTTERRSLPSVLQIGRGDAEALRADAKHRVRVATDALDEANRILSRHKTVLTALLPFGSADNTVDRLGRMVASAQSAMTALANAKQEVDAKTSDALALLDERVRLASEALEAADKTHLAASNKVTSLDTSLTAAHNRREAAETRLAQVRLLERAMRDNPLFDAAEVDRLREKLEAGDIDGPAQVRMCNDRASEAGKAAASTEADARNLLSRYRIEYGVNADVPGDWEGQARFAEEEHLRLSTYTLAERKADADAALQTAEQVFRTDVVQAILVGFDRVDEQVKALNKVLGKAPEFSNRERYHFRHRPVEQHKALHAFLLDSRDKEPEDSLWNEPAKLPPEFRDILEGGAETPILIESSPLYDYRRFFSYDVEIQQEGKPAGVLSKRFGPGSGGEHRTPLYVIFGAALAAAYGNLHGRNAGGGLMLLDEAFDKMDATNVRAVADYLNSLGLQLLMAGPETDQPKLSGFLDMYYDMSRHGTSTIHLERYRINDEARALLASDNPLLHPELLEQEMERIRAEQSLRTPPRPDAAGDAAAVG